jgi:hypothetical protein
MMKRMTLITSLAILSASAGYATSKMYNLTSCIPSTSLSNISISLDGALFIKGSAHLLTDCVLPDPMDDPEGECVWCVRQTMWGYDGSSWNKLSGGSANPNAGGTTDNPAAGEFEIDCDDFMTQFPWMRKTADHTTYQNWRYRIEYWEAPCDEVDFEEDDPAGQDQTDYTAMGMP